MRMQQEQSRRLHQELSQSEDEKSAEEESRALRKGLEDFEKEAMEVRRKADTVKALLAANGGGGGATVPEGVPPQLPVSC
jgi:hypothetical protein